MIHLSAFLIVYENSFKFRERQQNCLNTSSSAIYVDIAKLIAERIDEVNV